MTTKNHYYKSLQDRETAVAGAGKANNYSKLAEGSLLGFAIFLVVCGIIAGFTQNIGVFLFIGYAFVGIIAICIACLPLLGVIFVLTKVMSKPQVYGRQPETEGY